ncbi:MAG TPA: 2Fe-2S iron-sulfur cluster-binding protein, partial [Gemmatimonadales bacterium]|nr:2Fe-2S iron-sulfur cluster-binding protein [Gemmatimonadales bacterium]
MRIVVTTRSGVREFECAPAEKILHAGLRSGLELPYECGTGTCGTCKARLVSGRVESQWPDAPGGRYLKSEAELLMCQCVAREDCALEVAGLKTREASAPLPSALEGLARGGRRLTHDVAAFEVDLDRTLDFDAGQFALISIPGIAGARAYSMGNFARRARRLSFVVKRKPGGAVSEWLFGDGVNGTRLALFAPLGHATFQPGLQKHVLCIAGGSGIA